MVPKSTTTDWRPSSAYRAPHSPPTQFLYHLAKGVVVNPQKVAFGSPALTFLGHTVDKNSILRDADKLKVIQDDLPLTQLKHFLGMVYFYRAASLQTFDPLSPSDGYSHILAIVDRFTRCSEAIPIKDTSTDTLPTSNQHALKRTHLNDNEFSVAETGKRFVHILVGPGCHNDVSDAVMYRELPQQFPAFRKKLKQKLKKEGHGE
ncbi:hypothetical protein X801_06596, partial [Opisthorchis viverrini]